MTEHTCNPTVILPNLGQHRLLQDADFKPFIRASFAERQPYADAPNHPPSHLPAQSQPEHLLA